MREELSRLCGPDAYYLIMDGGISEEAMNNLWNDIHAKFIDNPERPIVLIITTDGGESTAATNFYSKVRFWGVKLYTVAVGSVFSAGLIIYLAGVKRFAHENAAFLMHGPHLGETTQPLTEDVLRNIADTLHQTTSVMKRIFKKHLRLSKKKIAKMMASETKILADEALKLGLAHKILE